jgi:hypothetical protein
VINAYAQYAKIVNTKSPNKASIWLLEGDFVQYTYANQSNPLTYTEEGTLIRDIANAIKTNAPKAIIAVNHSPWLANDVSNSFWSAMPLDVIDLAWVQGAGTTDTFLNSGASNATTATFAWLHTKTGKHIIAETSYQGTTTANVYYPQEPNLWSTTTVANVNARIANGVIGVLISKPPWTNAATFTTNTSALSSLNSTCN